MSNVIEVKIPDIGDFKNVPVIEILVKPGDKVKPEDPLVTLESDKATMDVPSPTAGVVKELKLQVGDKVSQGVSVLTLEAGDGAAVAAPAAAKPAEAAAERLDAKSSAASSTAPAPAVMGAGAPLSQPAAPSPDPRSPTHAGMEASSGAADAHARLDAGIARAHASPAVRRYARELGVDLGRVKGSGP